MSVRNKPQKNEAVKAIARGAIDWRIENAPIAYDQAVAFMETKAALIRDKDENDCVWLLEHPPLYTAGTSADPQDLLQPKFPVHQTGRGGQYTYHGPGQRIAYVMMDLQRRKTDGGPDLKKYVFQLEEWMVETLKSFGVKGVRHPGRVGIWVDTKPGGDGRIVEAKIAAIGVRVRRWVAYHGIALNVNPDLSHYDGIVPCGIRQYGVTSLFALGVQTTMPEVDAVLRQNFAKVFR